MQYLGSSVTARYADRDCQNVFVIQYIWVLKADGGNCELYRSVLSGPICNLEKEWGIERRA